MTATPGILDLDAGRAERAKARAAQHEGRGDILPVVFGGKEIARIPAEAPLSVFAPLESVDIDLAYVIKAVQQAINAKDRDQQEAGIDLLVNVIGANPGLPLSLLEAVRSIFRQVLGTDGYEAFTAMEPSHEDVQALVTGVLAWWGISLGESSPSPTSQEETGGETSKPISSGTTSSTRGGSGKRKVTKGSLVPGGS